MVDAKDLDQVKAEERRHTTADAGEECVHAHVIGHAIRWRKFCDPQTPRHLAAGGGDAEEDRADDNAGEAVRGEEGNCGYAETKIQDHA